MGSLGKKKQWRVCLPHMAYVAGFPGSCGNNSVNGGGMGCYYFVSIIFGYVLYENQSV